jgi:hypothetical protein
MAMSRHGTIIFDEDVVGSRMNAIRGSFMTDYMRLRRLRIYLLLGILLSVTTRVVAAPISDPVGDTFGVAPGPDVILGNAIYTSMSITFIINFNESVSPASANLANSLYGYIDIDSDQDPLTGGTPFVNLFAPEPPVSLSAEYFIDLSSEGTHAGVVDVLNASFLLAGTAPITFGSKSVSITLPLTVLGDDGLVNYALIVGTSIEPTDRAPNDANPATSSLVPEPSSFWLLCGPLTSLAYILRRQR